MAPSTFRLAEFYLVYALAFAALAMEVWALVDTISHRPDAFIAADKRTKQFWLIITGLCCAVGAISVAAPGAFFFLQLLGILGAGIYLADVRPALRGLIGYR
ncbi:MAG: DUF2516 family protein [Tetrasphaera sp.]|nr:DUF2516 family protein [Tetrasphaera sp.]